MRRAFVSTLSSSLSLAAATASAQVNEQAIGRPHEWQVWHQPAPVPLAAQLFEFHALVFWLMVGICVFVVGLLAYVMFRFSESRHPVPSRTTHHTLIEVVWTVVPVLILVVIAIPSFRLLYVQDRPPASDDVVNVKIVGHQWYWEYIFPDHDDLSFSSYMIPEQEIKPGQMRLMEVDNRLVLPVGREIRILVTAADVGHAWSVPAFGLKRDAWPGRIQEQVFRIEQPGVYYGQCYEICGINHAYMPIAVEAVPPAEFETWIRQKRDGGGQASVAPSSVRLAATDR